MTVGKTRLSLICMGVAVLLLGCNKNNNTSPNPSDTIPDEPGNITFVDLGLPSEVKWAAWNVGTDVPEGQGTLFSGYEAKAIDSKYLTLRCPTMAEFEELLDRGNCKWEYKKNYNNSGVDGYLVTSKKKGYTDRSIFIPGVNQGDYTVGQIYTTTLYDPEDLPDASLGKLEFQWDNREDKDYISPQSIRGVNPGTKLFVRLVSRDIDSKYRRMDYVNLGVSSGVKWGKKNVGAEAAYGYGDYFAWGETETHYTSDWKGDSHETPKSGQWKEGYGRGYAWITYKFTPGYDKADLPGEGDIIKYTDETLRTLEPADDAATKLMGEHWRMPTNAEMHELYEECYWEWTENYNTSGVAGYMVFKSRDKGEDHGLQRRSSRQYKINKDSHIFLPATGFLSDVKFEGSGREGFYWTSSLDLDNICGAHYLDFDYFEVFGREYLDIGFRCYGQPVRPVYNE